MALYAGWPMYGVFWMTLPHTPAAMVASASVSRMSRARYSSPAAMADSVLSMPPITVASAKGTASDRYGSASPITGTQLSVGHGMASASAPADAATGASPPPAAARIQKIAVPASTAANAPGMPQGRRSCPRRAASTMVSDVRHERVREDLERRQE